MDNFALRIKVPAGELKDIMDKLTEAQQTIGDCYHKLAQLGYLEITEAVSSNN